MLEREAMLLLYESVSVELLELSYSPALVEMTYYYNPFLHYLDAKRVV